MNVAYGYQYTIQPKPAARLDDPRTRYTGCPLCQSDNIGKLLAADCTKHPLYRPELPPQMDWCACGNCGHVFTDGYFTEAALTLIFGKAHENQTVGFDIENQRFISARMVEKVLPFASEGRWLDVGFGNASLLFTAGEYGFHPVGLELRRGNVDDLNGIGIEAHCVDVHAFQCREKFQVVSMADVLEHMPYPADALRKARELLDEGGVLFLSMPNMDSFAWKALDNNDMNPYWGELEHYHNFGRGRMYALLAECGFRPVRYSVSERYRAGMEIVAITA